MKIDQAVDIILNSDSPTSTVSSPNNKYMRPTIENGGNFSK